MTDNTNKKIVIRLPKGYSFEDFPMDIDETNENELKLLPCPFCGGEARFMSDSMDNIEDDKMWSYVICKLCCNRTDYVVNKDVLKCKQRTAKLWNRRVKKPNTR